MRILDIREESHQDGAATVTARVLSERAAAPLDLWFRVEGADAPLDGVGDALAVGMLTPCMFEQEPLAVEAAVSATLLDNMAQAQEVLASWYGYLSPIPISPAQVDRSPPPSANGARVACCFTAGVDSWYSLLKHKQEVNDLLLVRGFDIGLTNDMLWQETRARIAGIADRLGKRLITCETNLRELADKRLGRSRWGRAYDGDFWGECLHGSALAAVALLLQRSIGEVIIPATHTYRQIKPWGSSPLLDHLWSNRRLRVTHDGCEASRVDKTRALAVSDLALETLRVCYYNLPSYNCGHCEKCLRTMMALRACGALERAKTFPTRLSLREVHRTIVPAHVLHRYDELLAEARRVGDGELVKAVQIVMGQRLSAAQAFARLKKRVRNTAFGRRVRPLFLRMRRHPVEDAAGVTPPASRATGGGVGDAHPFASGAAAGASSPARPPASGSATAPAVATGVVPARRRRPILYRAANGLSWLVRRAAWRLREMEYACSLLEKEAASTVRVPMHARLRLWRRGFLGEAWALYGLRDNDCRDYLSDHARFVKTRLINGNYGVLLDDKMVFGRFLGDFARFLPEVFGTVSNGKIVATNGAARRPDTEAWLLDLLRRHGALVLKPVTGGGGRGFTLLRLDGNGIQLNGRRIDDGDLPAVIRACDGYMVCAYISQHPALARLYPGTTNTIRLVTMQDETCDAFIAAAVLRIGSRRSEPADNWTRGGLSARIDVASGRVGKAAAYPSLRDRLDWHTIHPDSGEPIAGFEVPGWSLIRNAILDMCRALPVLRYVGWDVVVTEDGFRILEGNNYTDVNLLQIHGPLLADERVAAFYRRHGVLRAA